MNVLYYIFPIYGRYQRMNNLRIAFLDPLGLQYNGNTLKERGLGGSESATILMARELSKIGFEVTIFNHCGETADYNGVEYRDISCFDSSTKRAEVPRYLQQDIVIVLRTVEPFLDSKYHALMVCAKFKAVWAHDTFLREDSRAEDLLVNGAIDELFVLSDFQNYYMSTCHHGRRRNPEVLKRKLFQTRNGVVRHIQEVDISKKDKNLFVYNASVSKGMSPLLENIWPLVKKNIPAAKLMVIGGYYKFKEGDAPDEQEQKWRQLCSDNHGKNGVEFTGIIKQDAIADILSEATFFLYPGAFPETFGISTLEALSYNVIPITTRFGALEETAVEKSSYLLDYAIEPNSLYPDINREQQIQKFVELTINAHRAQYLNLQKQQYCNIVHEVSSWSSIALQWKQHFVKKMNRYLPVDEYRKVTKINQRVHEIFGRRFSNPEELPSVKTVPEQRIVLIVPFYNASEYVAKCIRSIATQDYDNYKVYLIDDASTDNTLEVVRQTLDEFPIEIQEKCTTVFNKVNVGAVRNQVETMYRAFLEWDDIVMLLDGDDALAPRNDIFQFYNTLFDGTVDFAYGSCWSLADNIPLVAQPYPKAIRDAKSYRSYKFSWGMPYPHTRTFRGQLFSTFVKMQCTPFDEKNIDTTPFKDTEGNWYRAGGDNAVFYNLIEQADPNKIRAIQDIFYHYNDLNPNNDYKIHAEEQMKTANAIAPINIDAIEFKKLPVRKFVGLESLKKKFPDPVLAESKPPLEWKKEVTLKPLSVIADMAVDLSDKRILIAIPTNKYIETETFKSIYDLRIPEGYDVEFQYFYGYNISQIRNLIAEWGKRYDYLFCVDSDIVLPNDTLGKMLNANKDIITGCYVQRTNTNTLELFEKNGLGGVRPIPTQNILPARLMEVDACGFGCVLINSNVLKLMPYPHFVYTEALDHKNTISEDIYFCSKAKSLGYKIWADTSIICNHIGSTNFVPNTNV